MKTVDGEFIALNSFKTMDGNPLKVPTLQNQSPVFGDKKVKEETEIIAEKERIEEASKHIIKTPEQKAYEEKLQYLIQTYLNKIRERLDLQLSNFLLNNDTSSPKADENIARVLKQI